MNNPPYTFQSRVERWATWLSLLILVLQTLLVFGSWTVSAVKPDWAMRSLLSAEGIRWFVGSLSVNLSGSPLLWILLLSMAYGAVQFGGLSDVVGKRGNLSFWEKVGLTAVLSELIILIAILLLFTLLPHAILLGVTGRLYPSSISQSLLPLLCLSVCLLSVTFGLVSGRLRTLLSVCRCLTVGISRTLPLLLVYLLGAEFYASLQFVCQASW